MEQQKDFNKYRITSASTKKAIFNVFMDSFPIDKVKFEIVYYETKERIKCYMDIEDVLLLREKISFNQLFKTEQKVVVSRGGVAKSKETGKPISRIMEFSLSEEFVFISMKQGDGVLSETGLIKPAGEPTTSLVIRVTFEDLRKMFITIDAHIKAYLAGKVNRLVKEAQEEFNK